MQWEKITSWQGRDQWGNLGVGDIGTLKAGRLLGTGVEKGRCFAVRGRFRFLSCTLTLNSLRHYSEELFGKTQMSELL